MIPFSFTHSGETESTILDDIDDGKNISLRNFPYKPKTKNIQIEPNPELTKQFRGLSQLIGNYTNSTPYRSQIQLIKLAKSNAILRDDNKLTQQDIDAVFFYTNWINYDFKAI